MDKLNKLFSALSRWNMGVPIEGKYRYLGHKTIYESTTGEFKPCEREILVHRYLHRNLGGKFIRFQLEYLDRNYKQVKSSCWQYAYVLSAHYGNSTKSFGYISIRCCIANVFSIENVEIGVNTKVIWEEISEAWYNELIKMIKIN